MTTPPDPIDEPQAPTSAGGGRTDPLIAPRPWADASAPESDPSTTAPPPVASTVPQGWQGASGDSGSIAPTAPATGWAPVVTINPLPLVESEYHQLWRTPIWRWWRPIVAAGLFLVLVVGASMVFTGAAVGIDLANGRITQEQVPNVGTEIMTPLVFLANNLIIALFIPITWVCVLLLFKQRPGWLSSVLGRMRWRWLGLCLAIVSPIWIVWYSIETWLIHSPEDVGELAVNPDTWLLVIGILLTTPFQAAGEEVAIRGGLTRGVAGFFGNRVTGFVVATVVSSLVFMAIHFATDIWLNIFYLSFALVASWLTWRTGGLEAAIAIHVVNNLVAEALMPFSDITGMFDRSAGAAGPEVLIQVVVLLVAAAIIDVMARRRGVVRVFRVASPSIDRR